MRINSLSSTSPLGQLTSAPPVAQLIAPAFQGSLQGFQIDPNFLNRTSNGINLSQIHSDFLGVQNNAIPSAVGGDSALSMMVMLQSMIATFAQMLGSGPQGMQANGGMVGSPVAGFGVPNNGNAGGAIVPTASGGGGTPVQAGGQPAQAPAPQASTGEGASPVKIGPGTKVLQIGDSHSVGAFGKELDAKLRGTGAQVSTVASAGATASTFINGTSTKYGYWENKTDGSSRTVGYGKTAQTPKLDNLIAQERPSVIVVNLGANFRGSNPKSQVDQLGQVAKKHGIPIVWVGPPKTGKDGSNPGSLAKFDQEMASAVAPYGKYVSSNRHTPQYSGGDGLHYSGSKGTQIAKQWAGGVFKDIVG